MKNSSSRRVSAADGTVTVAPAAAVVVLAVAVMTFTGCSSRTDSNPPSASVTASNVTLTAAQRQHIQLYTVESVQISQND